MPLASWKWLAGAMLLAGALAMPGPAKAQDLVATQRQVNGPDIDPPPELIKEWERKARANAKACKRQDSAACVGLAYAYLKGQGVKQVRPIATVLYGEACELGNLDGCARQADIMIQGSDGGDPDPERGTAIADAACREGSDEACLVLARTLLDSDPAQADHGLALTLLDNVCRKGNAEACERAAWKHEYSPQADQWQAGEYYYLACLAGSWQGCRQSGQRAWNGIGIAPDPNLATFLIERGCEIDKDADCELARNLRQEPVLSARCDGGDLAACATLGEVLVSSMPVIDGTDRAHEVLVRACDAGEESACPRAAELQLGKAGVAGSPEAERAIQLLERACRPDNEAAQRACLTLGKEFLRGQIVEPNPTRAAELFMPLCRAGSWEACEYLPIIASEVPGIEMIAADTTYLPPVASGDEPSGTVREMERKPSAGTGCIVNQERYRGKLYVDRICRKIAYSINGFRLRRGQAPWQALLWRPQSLAGMSLSQQQRVMCGGTIIRTGWVLTAAHCLTDQGKDIVAAGHEVRLGVYNPREAEGTSYPILRAIPHPSFDPATYAFDIALVQYDPDRGAKQGMTSPITRLTLDPLELGKRAIKAGMEVYTYGWGWTRPEDGQSTDNLRGAKMELTSEERCTRITSYRGSALNAALCAGGKQGQQACKGDSGGGLVYYGDADKVPKVIGVVSAGRACGTVGEPSRYTRVAKVRDWLEQYIGPLSRR
ncbi:trypsin-like serine protease [Erythrobacter mangrovi]|uniref:Trypsin-like serine protease n=1 Tax=Erythrobacter mangrovi TaxID=2739433 RepID=A0A7D4BHS9_9SPHN|nr:trypsin-like serine protease [Erythrobacter mangrovi]QKG72422.1 trypsin-like serine protease [Erythrobacter mangrovi]